jgi:hypothetical protein
LVEFDRPEGKAGQLMDTPQELCRQVLASGRGPIEAIRAIWERFGLDLRQAKEVMLEAKGVPSSLDEHQQRLVPALEQAFELERASRHLASEDSDSDSSRHGAS